MAFMLGLSLPSLIIGNVTKIIQIKVLLSVGMIMGSLCFLMISVIGLTDKNDLEIYVIILQGFNGIF